MLGRYSVMTRYSRFETNLLTAGQPAAHVHQYTPTRTLRSTYQFFLNVARFSTEFGKRSFSYLAPTVWNGLPLNIRFSTHFRYLQAPSENSPFQIAHQHPYHGCPPSDCQRL